MEVLRAMVDWNRAFLAVRARSRARAALDATAAVGITLGTTLVSVGALALNRGAWPVAVLLGVGALVLVTGLLHRAWQGWRGMALLLDARVVARHPGGATGNDHAPGTSPRLTLDVREAFWLTSSGRGACVAVRRGRRVFRADAQAWHDVREGLASSLVLLPTGVVLCRADTLDEARGESAVRTPRRAFP